MSDSPATGLIHGQRCLPLEALAVQSRRAAAWLATQGVGQGTRVALLLRNDFAFVEATQGAALLGASTVPLNWHLTSDELTYILADSQARVLVVHADLLTPALHATAQQTQVVVAVVPAEGGSGASTQATADLINWPAALAEQAPLQAQPVPIVGPMFYTSGTTGRPKGVQRSAGVPPEVAAAAQRRSLAAWGLLPVPSQAPPRAVMTGPLYHSAPNAYGLNVLRMGGLLVLQPRFDAAELLALIEQHRISHLHLVPTMFARLLALPVELRQRHELSSLRHVSHGAAPCPPEVKRAMIEWWGPVIHEYYAMTETGIIATSTSAQWLAHPGTVGAPAEGVSIRITDDEGHTLPPGHTGEICLRSETTDFVSYHNASDKTAALRRDGYLRTGDVGHLTPDGLLFISDRRSDMVISGGVNIYPAEVEAAMLACPGVKDAAVFGVPDAEMGERVVAVVLRSDTTLTEAALLQRLRETLASFKLPRELAFDLPLPREDSGKVRKRLLREQFLASRPRQRAT